MLLQEVRGTNRKSWRLERNQGRTRELGKGAWWDSSDAWTTVMDGRRIEKGKGGGVGNEGRPVESPWAVRGGE